ncbi:MAG: FkbM family methyltransferase, partial [Caulobacterales bacterium]|nr:FkbM family methyltransferase [Caulobacterales bacterium]
MRMLQLALHWIREEITVAEVKHLLSRADQSIVYLDVGSAGGQRRAVRRLIGDGAFDGLCIDPRGEWGNERRAARGRHIRAALGGRSEQANLYITSHPGCSSVLEPDTEVTSAFPVSDWFNVQSVEKVELRSFADIYRDESIKVPTFVKLDVQGLEYDVLQGFGSLLERVQAIELECHLKRLYKNQKTLF